MYLLYDFQLLLHGEFKAVAADFTADVYDMGKPEDAFGVYSVERSPKYSYIPVGAEGYRSKGVLNFFQDRYYVKLSDPAQVSMHNSISLPARSRLGSAEAEAVRRCS